MLRTHENSDVFKTLDEIYLLRILLKKVNILYDYTYSVKIRNSKTDIRYFESNWDTLDS